MTSTNTDTKVDHQLLVSAAYSAQPSYKLGQQTLLINKLMSCRKPSSLRRSATVLILILKDKAAVILRFY